MRNIDSYYRSEGSSPYYSAESTDKLIPLTQLLAEVVANSDAVRIFRDQESQATIDLLATATGDGERDLRFNASYILAKVVDDDNLCVILHRLRDPNIGPRGQINLLQIAISGTSNAARQNVEAAEATAELLKDRTEGQAAVLVNLLYQIASSRRQLASPLPAESFCVRYNVETGAAVPISNSAPNR